MELGPIGVIHNLDFLTGGEATRLARITEELGYGALWLGEVVIGRDPFALAAHLLSNTKRLVIGTTAANVWKRDPLSMIGAARTLAELYPDRFVLGVGVSHEFLLTRYKVPHQKPLSFMTEYLAAMKSARYLGPAPANEPPIVLGALFPKMTALANAQTQGVFPNLATPEHTARVRSLMAPEKWLCVTQTLTLEIDPAKARHAGRTYCSMTTSGLPIMRVTSEAWASTIAISKTASAIGWWTRWWRGVTRLESKNVSRPITRPAPIT